MFLYLQKAFDAVSHEQLLERLIINGFRGISLKLFRSYLLNRTQFVSQNGEVVKYGVPKGIVVGPVLFLQYTNGLLNGSGDVTAFADDTTIIIEGNSWTEV